MQPNSAIVHPQKKVNRSFANGPIEVRVVQELKAKEVAVDILKSASLPSEIVASNSIKAVAKGDLSFYK